MPFRGGDRCVLGDPKEYYSMDEDILQSFLVHKGCVYFLFVDAEQLVLLNNAKINEKQNNASNMGINNTDGSFSGGSSGFSSGMYTAQ
jgi:hypothetical protein